MNNLLLRRRMLMQAGGSPTPPSVQFVEYLENTQTNASLASWLLTDFCPNRDDARVIVDCEAKSGGDRFPFSTANGGNKMFHINLYSNQPYYRFIDHGYMASRQSGRHTYELGAVMKVDGVAVYTYSGSGTLVGNTDIMAIFGAPNAPTPTAISYPFVGPIYDVQCYYGNTLVRHYRPAREGTIGCAFETVTQQYIYNMGTTPFSFGPDIN